MKVRALSEDDVVDFWRLRLRGFQEEPEAFGSSFEEQAGRPLAEVAEQIRDEGHSFVVGAFTSELVGIAGLRREPRLKRRHRAGLWGMYVAPEARGQGVGRALVEEMIRRARAVDGLEQILLTVTAHNAPALALYRALGFVSYGHAQRALRVGERSFDEELMRLDLLG